MSFVLLKVVVNGEVVVVGKSLFKVTIEEDTVVKIADAIPSPTMKFHSAKWQN